LKPTKGATMKGTGGTASEPKDEPPAADAGQVPTEPGPDQPPGRSLSADIFISYSRKDIAFARLLRSSLESSGLNTWIDWERIPVGEQWWSEISQAIERCNVFMFIISASSIGSSVCKDEINEALKNHKRVIPVLVDNVTPEAVREFIPELPGLNWVVFEKDHLFRLGEDAEAAPGRDEDRLVALPNTPQFEQALAKLTETVHTDWDWVKAHTQLQVDALRWSARGRDASYLVRGSALEDAEGWLARAVGRDPQPTLLQSQFISAGRLEEARRQREAARRQRRLLRVIAIALVVTVALGCVAIIQRSDARREAHIAQGQARLAESGDLAAESTNVMPGNAGLGALLSLESLRLSANATARAAVFNALGQPLDTILSGLSSRDIVGDFRPIDGVTFSPDGKILAIVQDDGNVVLWDTATHARLGELGDGNAIGAVAFSPDGKTVAAGDNDGNVVLWDTAMRTRLARFSEVNPIDSLAFSPDGKTLAGGDDEGLVVLWDTATGTRLGQLGQLSGDAIVQVAFSPDGKSLVTAGSGGVVLWDTATRSRLGQLGSHMMFFGSVAFSPNGQTLATANASGAALWDLATRSKLGQLGLTNSSSQDLSAAYSPDGKILAIGDDEGNVVLWDTATRTQLAQISDGSTVDSLAFSPDGKTLVAGDYDGNVVLWDTATRTQLAQHAQFGGNDPIGSVTFRPDGKALAVAYDNTGKVVLRDTATRTQLGQLGKNMNLVGVAFSPDGKTLATVETAEWGLVYGKVVLWDTATRTQLGQLGSGDQVCSVAFSPDGKTLATADFDGKVVLWDAATHTKLGELSGGLRLDSVAFSPDGTTLAAGNDEDDVVLWDTAKRAKLGELSGGNPNEQETFTPQGTIAFSPDGKTLGAVDASGNVVLWDTATRTQLGQLSDGSPTESVAFSPDGKTLATGDDAGNVVLWDTATRTQLGQLSGDVQIDSVAFSPDGKDLASADLDGTVALVPSLYWAGNFVRVQKILCAEVGANLTRAQWRQYVPNEPYRAICPVHP
jgi:WD40 repeat protein